MHFLIINTQSYINNKHSFGQFRTTTQFVPSRGSSGLLLLGDGAVPPSPPLCSALWRSRLRCTNSRAEPSIVPMCVVVLSWMKTAAPSTSSSRTSPLYRLVRACILSTVRTTGAPGRRRSGLNGARYSLDSRQRELFGSTCWGILFIFS